MANAADLIKKHQFAEPTFEIPLGDNAEGLPEVMVVRNPKGAEGMIALRKKAKKFFEMCGSKRCPEAWKPFLPISEETAFMVCEITSMVVSPPFTDVEALELARDCGPFLAMIHGSILLNVAKTLPLIEESLLDEPKNESTETASSGNT